MTAARRLIRWVTVLTSVVVVVIAGWGFGFAFAPSALLLLITALRPLEIWCYGSVYQWRVDYTKDGRWNGTGRNES